VELFNNGRYRPLQKDFLVHIASLEAAGIDPDDESKKTAKFHYIYFLIEVGLSRDILVRIDQSSLKCKTLFHNYKANISMYFGKIHGCPETVAVTFVIKIKAKSNKLNLAFLISLLILLDFSIQLFIFHALLESNS
jgi:hypothetical protein